MSLNNVFSEQSFHKHKYQVWSQYNENVLIKIRKPLIWPNFSPPSGQICGQEAETRIISEPSFNQSGNPDYHPIMQADPCVSPNAPSLGSSGELGPLFDFVCFFPEGEASVREGIDPDAGISPALTEWGNTPSRHTPTEKIYQWKHICYVSIVSRVPSMVVMLRAILLQLGSFLNSYNRRKAIWANVWKLQIWSILAHQGLALLTLSWDKNWDSHFYPRIALVAQSPRA